MSIEPSQCRACGSDEISFGYSAPPFQWEIMCHADGREVLVVADTEAEALMQWEAGEWSFRVVGHDETGRPVYSRRDDIKEPSE